MHRLGRVAHAAFAEELRLAEIRIPARAADPAAHHETSARHAVNVAGRDGGEECQNLVTYFFGAAFVSIEAEYPIAAAGRDSLITQIAKTVERYLDDAGAKSDRDLGGAVGAVGIDDDDLIGPQHA